jgi:hypothetical protein
MDLLTRLDLTHLDQIERLFFRCHSEDAIRRILKARTSDLYLLPPFLDEYATAIRSNTVKEFKKTVPVEWDVYDPYPEIYDFWILWISAMKRWYLKGDVNHCLYGLFRDNALIAMGGYRSDLPKPYNNGWVVVYLKTDPDVSFSCLNPIWEKIYQDCEDRGMTTWHCLIEPERQRKFDAWYRRNMININDRYTYHTSVNIPAGTQPEVDWVWAMMGRKLSKVDFIIRTGVRNPLTSLN